MGEMRSRLSYTKRSEEPSWKTGIYGAPESPCAAPTGFNRMGDPAVLAGGFQQTPRGSLGASPRARSVGRVLTKSCRVVVQFHAEWNPAVLEQQIGRVDRKGSLWEQCAEKWLEARTESPPAFVEVRQLVFEGTYDAFQWDRVMRRQHVFDASLFGALLPAESWLRVPREQRQKLIDAAPSFSPDDTSRK
jgi:hypothetical protein